MMSQIRTLQSGLRLRSLALLLQIIAVILISFTFLMMTGKHLERVQILFEDSSKIIFEGETSSQLGYGIQLCQESIRLGIDQNNHSLISIQELYKVISNQQRYIPTQTYRDRSHDGCYKKYNCQQFMFHSKSAHQSGEHQKIQNLTMLLNEYVFEFAFFDDHMSVISYIDYETEGFYLQYPTLNDYEAQSLQIDNWLRDFRSTNMSNVLMPPIFNYANGPIYLMLFKQLIVEPNFVNGALRYDQAFQLNRFPQLYNIIADQNWNIHTSYGIINYSSLEPIIPYPKYPQYKLTLQSVTGFDQENWIKIMTQEQSFVYNDVLKKNVFARKQKFQSSDMVLVVYQDVSDYLIEQDQIMTQLQSFETEIVQRFQITIFIFIVAASVIQAIIMIKILQPLAKLTLMVQNQIYSISRNDIRASFAQQLAFRNLQVKSSLKQLYSAIIQQKKESSERKSGLCSIYQRFIYPRINMESLKLNLQNVPEYEPISTDKMLKLFDNTHF